PLATHVELGTVTAFAPRSVELIELICAAVNPFVVLFSVKTSFFVDGETYCGRRVPVAFEVPFFFGGGVVIVNVAATIGPVYFACDTGVWIGTGAGSEPCEPLHAASELAARDANTAKTDGVRNRFMQANPQPPAAD